MDVSPDECINLCSDDELEIDDQLADETKKAQKDEKDRIKRLDARNELLTQVLESQYLESQSKLQLLTQKSKSQSQDTESDNEVEDIDPNELLLDYDSKKNEKITVHPEITKLLKPHQKDGIKFMYDNCYGNVDQLDKSSGSGCILAHCMGLGKEPFYNILIKCKIFSFQLSIFDIFQAKRFN